MIETENHDRALEGALALVGTAWENLFRTSATLVASIDALASADALEAA